MLGSFIPIRLETITSVTHSELEFFGVIWFCLRVS